MNPRRTHFVHSGAGRNFPSQLLYFFQDYFSGPRPREDLCGKALVHYVLTLPGWISYGAISQVEVGANVYRVPFRRMWYVASQKEPFYCGINNPRGYDRGTSGERYSRYSGP